jgi:hypothetical protein
VAQAPRVLLIGKKIELVVTGTRRVAGRTERQEGLSPSFIDSLISDFIHGRSSLLFG